MRSLPPILAHIRSGPSEAAPEPPSSAGSGPSAESSEGLLWPTVRVLLADDHRIVREGLTSLLSAVPGIEVVGEAADGAEAVDLALELEPDVVVMDVTMPELNGVEATRRILKQRPEVRVIGLSMHSEAEMVFPMREAGACAYLTKGGPAGTLIDAIRNC